MLNIQARARPTKTWAQMKSDNITIAAVATFDATLVPGKDIDASWAKEVTSVAGIEAGWTLNSDGTWSGQE